jgi:predicted regulator of Ras-like GTPase activity (Roadblock/LC7/MglB family)
MACNYKEEALMSFRETLKGLVVNVAGGQGAVMMGYDGIPIDEFVLGDASLDVQLLSVEYATLLKEIKRTVELLKIGEMEEISITTGLSRVIVRPVSQEFFVVLVLDREGNFGKGRFLLKREVPKLAEELQ